jgi:hypothetical protein
MKYIIRGFETLGNVSHFTKIDAIGHIRKILPNKSIISINRGQGKEVLNALQSENKQVN